MQGTLTARGHVQAPEVEALLQYAGARIHADLSAQLQEPLPRYRAALRIDGLALAQVLPQPKALSRPGSSSRVGDGRGNDVRARSTRR